MPAAAQPYATAPVAQGGSRALALSHARSELDVGERELVVAGGDCRAACRALGSMDRAAGHLCELANDGSERSTCEDAKTTLLGARDRVRTTCGSCPGGASVERTAPIPSVP